MAETPHKPHDLFVSYADSDRSWVEGYLLDALTQAGVRCHTEATFRLGVPRLEEFECAVRQSARTLLVFSSAASVSGFARFLDLLAQSYGVEAGEWPVIPLLRAAVELPTRLAMLTHLDATDPSSWPAVVERLCAELRHPIPSPAPKPACPYPGMVPFSASDARFFYGRAEEIDRGLQHLRQQRLLLVIGPSGCGKSSLVHAGMLPLLPRSGYFPSGFWLVRGLRPGSSPLRNLTEILGTDSSPPAQALADLLAQHAPAQRLLLVVDQLEELFTQNDRAVQCQFLAALKGLRAEDNCALLLSMRADFYADLMNSDLWPIDAGQRLEIGPLRGEALRQAIKRPAAEVGVHLEAGLLERLFADAAEEPGVLPLLQETMVLLWEKMERRLLPYHTYEQLGQGERSGLAVAMARKADATLAELTETQQRIARRILLRLVQFGEGRADTRRQQPLAELRSVQDDPAEFDRALEHLTRHRLLTRSGEEEAGGVVDIAHEMLIIGWPRCQDWVRESREAEQTRRRLEGSAEEWVRRGCGEGGLLDEVELQEAEGWLAGHGDEMGVSAALRALAGASRQAVAALRQAAEEAREQRVRAAEELAAIQQRRAEEQAQAAAKLRKRLVVTLLAGGLALVLAVAAGTAAFWALQERENAQKQERVAQTNARTATSRRLALLSRVELDYGNLDLALLLAVRAMQTERTMEARGSLFTALQGSSALKYCLGRHRARVWSVAFSPDRRTLASGSADGIVKLWDTVAGQEIATLTGHTKAVNSVVFSRDGQLLASGSEDQNILLWDVAKKEIVATLTGHSKAIWSVAFSRDGQTLASGSDDRSILLWNVAEKKLVGTLTGHTRAVSAVAFNHNGQMLASGSDDQNIKLWNVADRKEITTLQGHDKAVWSVAFSHDGQALASGSEDQNIKLWNVAERKATATLTGHVGAVHSVAFSPDDKLLASGSYDRTVKLWARAKDKTNNRVTFTGHAEYVNSVAFSTDGKVLASGGGEGAIRLWDMVEGHVPQKRWSYRGAVWELAFSQDSQTLLSKSVERTTEQSYRGTIQAWHIPADENTTVLQEPAWARKVAYSPDGKTLALSGKGTIQLWDAVKRKEVTTLTAHAGDIFPVAFSPDGRMLASGSEDGTIQLWDALERKSIATLAGHDKHVTCLAFSPDGKTLASGSYDETVRLWDVASGNRIAILREHANGVLSVAFSHNGKQLVSGGNDKQVRLWDVAAAANTDTFTGHLSVIHSLAFSRDDRILASADGLSVRLWDLSSRQLFGETARNGAAVAAFSPNGKWLATGGTDGVVRLWDLDESSWAVLAQALANREFTPEERVRYAIGDRGP